ncbi:hypothetical protein ACVI1N_004694 [Sinorhizobium medicae]
MRCGSLIEGKFLPEGSREHAFGGCFKNVGGSLSILVNIGRVCCEPRAGQKQ